jgi:hypothetical protein
VKLRFPRRRKTEQITVETDQILVIRRQRVTRTWCDECQRHTEFIPVEEIKGVLGGGLIPANSALPGLHFAKALNGSTVVCAESLTKKF